MAHQNYEINLRDADDPIDPHKFKESFVQASCEENKRVEFDLKYSVPYILALIRKDFGNSLMEDLALSSSDVSSSFQLLRQAIAHLASRPSDSERNMPQLWKDLITMSISDPPVMEEPALEETLGSNLGELERVGVDEEQNQEPNIAATINSNPSHTFSSATSVTNYSGNTVTPPNSSVPPETIIDMRMTPPASPPQEDNKLVFTVFAVELLGALTNLVSSRPKHNQVLMYFVVACSTLAFSISSTAHVLHKKRPTIAKKMQIAAFLIGSFGFMGIMGMLLPSTISWCFTVSAFLVFMLMFVVASLIK